MNGLKKTVLYAFLCSIVVVVVVGIWIYSKPILERELEKQKVNWERQREIAHQLIAVTKTQLNVMMQINSIVVFSPDDKIDLPSYTYMMQSLPEDIEGLRKIEHDLKQTTNLNIFSWLCGQHFLGCNRSIWWDINFTEIILYTKLSIVSSNNILVESINESAIATVFAKILTLSTEEAKEKLFMLYVPAVQTLTEMQELLKTIKLELEKIKTTLNTPRIPI